MMIKEVSMSEIIFKDNKIQKGYRIKIPKAVIDTLDLSEGQDVVLNFDVDKKSLIINTGGLKK
jgi:bifunctional DNA-binding transcriptional regulator/antitoxin component of YhaV-PrlF toxin-antitoxin module